MIGLQKVYDNICTKNDMSNSNQESLESYRAPAKTSKDIKAFFIFTFNVNNQNLEYRPITGQEPYLNHN